MKELKNLFDDFNLHARIIPALITTIPIYIYLVLIDIIDPDFTDGAFINSMVCLLLVAIFYRVVRNLGKKYEGKMYKKLGAKPTTIILRYSNDLINDVTKTRYHKKLNEKIEGIKLPVKKDKETNDDDLRYDSAIDWLRKYANENRDKESRVYQELKDYNFWRNLYGGKIIIIVSCFIAIIFECFRLRNENIFELIKFPYPKCVILMTMVIILIISCITVNRKKVEEKAFDYAKTLLEVCDSL